MLLCEVSFFLYLFFPGRRKSAVLIFFSPAFPSSFSILLDPWWNPAAEMQAIDRTHRIGQYKPIFATRFILENTIEERILKLQEKKQLVFDSTVGGDAASLARLTVDDLRFLFSNN